MQIARYIQSLAAEWKRTGVMKVKGQILRYRYPDLIVGHKTILRYDSLAAIRIGANVNIGPFCEIVAIRKTHMSHVPGELIIGRETAIGAFANIRAAGGPIEIGEYGMIAQHATLVAANHGVMAGAIYCRLPYEPGRVGVRLGRNVWIGAGAVVLPGTSVGENSVIAAGAVVNKDVPAGEVWGGVPARRLGAIRSTASMRERREMLESAAG